MVEKRSRLEIEVQEIFELIDKEKNFLLSGGAGSGKTYSLVSVIRQVIAENPTAKIACMTYTNAAVKEIEERVNHKNLNVSTIHDFLWDNIKHFQKELKKTTIELINDENETKFSLSDVDFVDNSYFDQLKYGIQYKEYKKIREGIISHDEVLVVANKLFANYPKLGKIVKNKYKFIFIDEYQDTSKLVIEIFLTHFKNSGGKNIIGFFGDAMQSIYDGSIGNLDEYKGTEKVKEIKKVQNRRNPRLVIDLANILRTDGISQEPSNDSDAPNMENGQVKQGNVSFLYSKNEDISVENVKSYLESKFNWDFSNVKETKELNLTHNLIADKAGFRTLMEIYDRDQILKYKDRIRDYIEDNNIETDFTENTFGEVIDILKEGKSGSDLRAVSPTRAMQIFIENNKDLYEYARSLNYGKFSKLYITKDALIDDKKQNVNDENKKDSKRDNLIKHLFKIQNNIYLYQNKKYNEFLRITDFRSKVTSIAKKIELKESIENLIDVGKKTIEIIINEANEMGLCLIDDNLNDFKSKNEYLYKRVKDVKFIEFQNLYKYLEGLTPFSTQHKTKGAEFENVLVILDNGNWNSYNFENLFLNSGTPSVLERTQKIFYVCCTRAKENLAVFYHNPTEDVITKAKEWFGAGNVLSIDDELT